MNIFEIIREDHETQRDLLDQLVQTVGASDERVKIFNELKGELTVHAAVEERHFYIPLIEEDMTQEHARHGVHEHHEIDEILEKLNETPMESPAWLVHAKSLQEQVEHHLKDEEHTIFQLAGKVLSDSAKVNLAVEYSKEREQMMKVQKA